MKTPQFIDPKNVRRVYTGRPGCQCGCRGKYTENPEHRDEIVASSSRDESDWNFNATSIKRIVANMNKRIAELMSGERKNYEVDRPDYRGQMAVEFTVSPTGVYLQDNETNRRWFAYFTP